MPSETPRAGPERRGAEDPNVLLGGEVEGDVGNQVAVRNRGDARKGFFDPRVEPIEGGGRLGNELNRAVESGREVDEPEAFGSTVVKIEPKDSLRPRDLASDS